MSSSWRWTRARRMILLLRQRRHKHDDDRASQQQQQTTSLDSTRKKTVRYKHHLYCPGFLTRENTGMMRSTSE